MMCGTKYIRFYFTMALALLCVLPFFGQSPPFTFKHFSTREGLSDLDIHAIVRDQFDNLWLGTPSGLYVYNGVSAERFEYDDLLGNTYVTCLYFVSQNIILAGTFSDGLFQINPIDHQVIQYNYDPKIQGGISANRIHCIAENEKGLLLIALEKEGIDLFDPTTGIFENHKITDCIENGNANRNNTVLSMDTDPVDEDVVWLGTLDGLVKFHTGKNEMTHYRCTRSNTLDPETLNSRENTIKSIHCENELLYAGTWGGGLCIFNKNTGIWSTHKFQSPFPASGMRNDVVQLLPKSNDELWVLAYGQEIGLFDKNKRTFSFHGYPNIKTLYRDSQSNLWFGTLGNGLYAWFPKMNAFRKTALPYKLTKMIVHPAKQVAYAGIYGKKSLLEIDLNTHKFRQYPFLPYFDKEINFISDLQFDSSGKLYLLGQTGVYLFDQNNRRIKKVFSPYALPDHDQTITSSTSFLVDKNDNLWYATKFDGLYRYNLKSSDLKHYLPDPNEGHTAWVSDLFEDGKGRIWYGSGKGFGYYDYRKEAFSAFPTSRGFTFPDSLDFNSITSIAEDAEGNIWIGDLKKGLGKLNLEQDRTVHSFTVESAPLLDDVIFDLSVDGLGHLWFRTREGLSRYSPKTGRFQHFGNDFGLTDIHSMTISGEDQILFASNYGFYTFQADETTDSLRIPAVRIDRFLVFNTDYLPTKSIDDLAAIELDYKQNYFSVNYGCSDYFYPHLVRYRYRMKGVHDEWIKAGTRRFASFSNLGGGTYQLQIAAGYGEHLYGDNKILNIIVEPPFWQKTWFWILAASIIVFIIWFAFNQRIRNVKKKEAIKAGFEKRVSEAKLLALQAQMNPHFLFNCLNSIKLLTIENKVGEASDYLTRFSRLIRYILNNSKHFLVPLNDEIDALRIYIEMESLRFNHEFIHLIDIDPAIDTEKIYVPPMILQVFVENAIKHGLRPKEKDKKLEVRFRLFEDTLVCTIRDNGIGRQAAANYQTKQATKKESLGIKNTLERLDQLRQVHNLEVSVEIQDVFTGRQPGGTLVTITFPI